MYYVSALSLGHQSLLTMREANKLRYDQKHMYEQEDRRVFFFQGRPDGPIEKAMN